MIYLQVVLGLSHFYYRPPGGAHTRRKDITVRPFTVIVKIHPKSPSAMDFGTPESFSYGQYSKCADMVE